MGGLRYHTCSFIEGMKALDALQITARLSAYQVLGRLLPHFGNLPNSNSTGPSYGTGTRTGTAKIL